MSERPPPFYSQEPQTPLRPRPVPPPRHLRRKWRYRGGIIIGMILILLALSTVYLGAPESYFNAESQQESDSLEVMPQENLPPEIPPQDMLSREMPSETMKPLGDAPPEIIAEPPAPPKKVKKKKKMVGYFVQLSSERSRAIAQRRLTMFRRDHPDLLRGLSSVIKKADLGARGVFFRLYVGPAANKRNANDLCAALKQRGSDCLVRKL